MILPFLFDTALGKPDEAEAMKGVNGFTALPAAIVGIGLALYYFVADETPKNAVPFIMLGGGLACALSAVAVVNLLKSCFGFGAVAWVPLGFGGTVAGAVLLCVVNEMLGAWEYWPLTAVPAAALPAAGVGVTYWLRGLRPRPDTAG